MRVAERAESKGVYISLLRHEAVLRDMASKRQENIKLENIEAKLSARKAG